MTTSDKTCSTCRYVSTHKRPRIMDSTGFGDQLMFEDSDKDETVYTCRAFATYPIGPDVQLDADGTPSATAPVSLCEHAGKEIGLVPITCSAWSAAPAVDTRLAEMDAMIERRNARNAKRSTNGGE